MRFEPFLRDLADLTVLRPPRLWEADTEEEALRSLVGEMTASALVGGARPAELSLLASNIVVEPPEDGDDRSPPEPGEYVSLTLKGPSDLGRDETWHPSACPPSGLFPRLHRHLVAAGAEFAYVRRHVPGGSFTVFFRRMPHP
jgi:hypothetical protein